MPSNEACIPAGARGGEEVGAEGAMGRQQLVILSIVLVVLMIEGGGGLCLAGWEAGSKY